MQTLEHRNLATGKPSFKMTDYKAGKVDPSIRAFLPDKEVISYYRIVEQFRHFWLILKYLVGYGHVINFDGS